MQQQVLLNFLFQELQQRGTQNNSDDENYTAMSPIVEQLPQITVQLDKETNQVNDHRYCSLFFLIV